MMIISQEKIQPQESLSLSFKLRQKFLNFAPAGNTWSNEFVGIEFDRSLIKQIRVQRQGKQSNVRYLKVKFVSSEDDEKIKAVLKEHLLEMGAQSPIRATISIPRHRVHAKVLRLPSHEPQELHKMITNYLQKEIPLPEQEIVCDFSVVTREDEGYSLVLVIMARKKDIARYNRICQEVGITVEAVRLNLEATYHAFIQAYKPASDLQSECMALIDVDFSSTNMLVIHRGDLSFCRSLGHGVGELIDRIVDEQSAGEYESWIDELCEGVRNTIRQFETSFENPKIEYLVLTGWVPRMQTFVRRMQTNLNLLVDWFDPAISLRSLAETETSGVAHQWFSISALLGMAFSPPQEMMDIRPLEVRKQQKKQNTLRQLAVSGAIVLYLMALLLTVTAVSNSFRHDRIAALEAGIAQLRPKIRAVQQARQIHSTLNEQLGSSMPSAAIVAQVLALLPQEISLSSLTFTRGEQILLRGTGQSMVVVINLSNKLAYQSAIKKAMIRSASRFTEAGNKTMIAFEMQIELEKDRNRED